MVVDKNTVATISEQLPVEIQDYNIDWKKVISKFAIGTSIIIAVGIVNHVTAGSTYFVFGSSSEVARDALIGGAISAALREVIECVKKGKPVSKAAKKYAIEGFADGFMWGAIASVLKIVGKNFKRIKAFKLATGSKLEIKADGTVFNDSGHRIGRAYYDNNKIWHLVDETNGSFKVFDAKGKELKLPIAKMGSAP